MTHQTSVGYENIYINVSCQSMAVTLSQRTTDTAKLKPYAASGHFLTPESSEKLKAQQLLGYFIFISS
jgi:hypothetical protein